MTPRHSIPLACASTLLCALSAGVSTAQTFTQVFPATTPSATVHHSSAYDVARSETVIFTEQGETWTYNGTDWTQKFPLNAPSPRQSSAMCYDLNRSVCVLFGGRTTGGPTRLNDTWEWDGTDWTQRFPATTTPNPRMRHELVFDAIRGVCVAYGDHDALPFNPQETLEWDGTDWTVQTLTPSPPKTDECTLAYDLARGVTVYRGAWDGFAGTYVDETWEYDGTGWVEVETAHSPPGATWQAMEYDAGADVTVWISGFPSVSAWQYDGFDWAEITSPGPGVYAPSMAYDLTRNTMVLYGGGITGTAQNGTWEYDAGPIGNFSPFGTGCGTAGGPLTIAQTTGMPPVMGGTLGIDVTNLDPSNSSAFVVVDLGFVPAGPVDLGLIGMTGCTLYRGVTATIFAGPAVGGTAQTTLPIPAATVAPWLGHSIWLQALALEPSANALGLTASNGARAKLGN